jgi:hypothetical protein
MAAVRLCCAGGRAGSIGVLRLPIVREFLPKDYEDVRDMFGRRGAYRNFRALVTKRRVLDRWYDFESKATERAVREWCELNEIEVTD